MIKPPRILVDENGNPIFIDKDGNPIKGRPPLTPGTGPTVKQEEKKEESENKSKDLNIKDLNIKDLKIEEF